MNPNVTARRWLAAIVLIHLAVSAVHGSAHQAARVPLSPAANLFVVVVILVGPLLGLALMRAASRTAAWVIAATMAASFVFGIVNHFMIAGPDHVAQVALQQRAVFATTAGLLGFTEAVGCGLAVRVARERTVA
jgi:hypothetical protein